MALVTNILVPTDFSETADHALDYAVHLAQTFDARIHLLHVIGLLELGVPELGVALASSVMDSQVREGQAALDRLVERWRSEAKFGEVSLRTGDARDVTVQVAGEVAADLIVIGTHGRHGLARALFGSVAESVVRHAACPVVTVSARAVRR